MREGEGGASCGKGRKSAYVFIGYLGERDGIWMARAEAETRWLAFFLEKKAGVSCPCLRYGVG